MNKKIITKNEFLISLGGRRLMPEPDIHFQQLWDVWLRNRITKSDYQTVLESWSSSKDDFGLLNRLVFGELAYRLDWRTFVEYGMWMLENYFVELEVTKLFMREIVPLYYLGVTGHEQNGCHEGRIVFDSKRLGAVDIVLMPSRKKIEYKPNRKGIWTWTCKLLSLKAAIDQEADVFTPFKADGKCAGCMPYTHYALIETEVLKKIWANKERHLHCGEDADSHGQKDCVRLYANQSIPDVYPMSYYFDLLPIPKVAN